MKTGKPDSRIIIRNGTIVTMNVARDIFTADILIENDRILKIGSISEIADKEIDARGKVVLPGFIQTHTHLCQALFRNQADDLPLIEWLQQYIWPMEAAHTEESIAVSARLGLAEMLHCGTTTIMDFGTMRHTDVLFAEAEKAGIRAIIGKSLMDSSEGVAVSLCEPIDTALSEVEALIQDWHGVSNNRLQFALTPRFLLSCSPELLRRIREMQQQYPVIFHTHAAETQKEVAVTQKKYGMGNIEYLNSLGLLGSKSALAHCIWLSEAEQELLAKTGTSVLHCPSANLKLASGFAAIPEMLKKGISVSIGADGAACNNNMNILEEMRLAALVQKYRLADAKALPAQKVVEMATIGGAKTVGMEMDIGSLEAGKKADIILLDLQKLHSVPAGNIYGQLVYSARPENVETVMVDGKICMYQRQIQTIETRGLPAEAEIQLAKLYERMNQKKHSF
ncbi:5'-deoxyadenosine deaminase [bacterium]|nr:5'-deoxyadenosine deaminase [bacterium]